MSEIIRKRKRVGRICVPWQFYFKGERLEGTHWGGKKHKCYVVNKRRCNIGPPHNKYAHNEITLRKGYECAKLEWSNGYFIKHYWMDNYRDLAEKHLRYIESEANEKYENGEEFPGWMRLIWRTLRRFKFSMVDEEGWKEGKRGLFLSLFWAIYKGCIIVSLKRKKE
jgi:hypothetical protein